MTGDPAVALMAFGSSPWAIALAIVIGTFVVEDVTTVTAALCAAAGIVPPSVALAALFVGIFIGDIALYGVGAAARARRWARHLIGERRMVKGRAWLKKRYTTALIGARFMPGFRMPAFTASGFLGLPFWHFVGVAAVAGIAWTGLVFSLVFYFGLVIADQLGPWRWLVAAALVLAVFLGPFIAERLGKQPVRKHPEA